MRFVVFADLHLDAPFGWAGPDAARRRRHALRETLRNVLALADEVNADALLCAGDLYEHDRVTPDTAAFLRSTFGDTHRRVLLAPGNHDWYGPTSVYTRTDWSANVTVFPAPHLAPVPLDDGLTVWGAAHCAPANTDGFLDSGFAVDRGGVNLGLFHGSERAGLGLQEEGKRPHAPFTEAQVPAAGLSHAFVGHHHRPRDGDHHTYPGNPDPLTFGEDGTRGAVVVEVAGDGLTRERRPVAVTEAHDVEVPVTGCVTVAAVRERAEAALHGRSGVARLTLTGELSPDVDLHLDDVAGVRHTLDGLVVRHHRLAVAYDVDRIATEATVRGQFVRDVLAAGDLDGDERRRILTTGLRALDGRDDLEAA